MVKMYAPKDVTQVSVEAQNFKVNRDGMVTVPDNFVPRLVDIGFKLGAAITVTAETAQAIKNTAAQLEADTSAKQDAQSDRLEPKDA